VFPDARLPADLQGLQKQVFDLAVAFKGKLTPEIVAAAKASGLLQERAGLPQEALDPAKALAFYKKYGDATDENYKKVVALLNAATAVANTPPTPKVSKKTLASHVDEGRSALNRLGSMKVTPKVDLNLKLLTGGLVTVEAKAKAAGKQVGASLSGGISAAKNKVDALNTAQQGIKAPIKTGTTRTDEFSRGMTAAKDKVEAVRSKLMGLKPPIDDSKRETQELLTALGYVSRSNPRVNITGIDPAVQKATELFRTLERLDGKRVTSYATVVATLRQQGRNTLTGGLRPDSGIPKNSASGNYLSAFQPSWVGERGREMWVPEVPGRVLSHQDSMRAVQGSGGGVNVIFQDGAIRTADPVRAAHEALRMQRDRLFVESL
jgi:hypothetical protein